MAVELLDDHLRRCLTDDVARGSEEARDKVNEAPAAVARLVRS